MKHATLFAVRALGTLLLLSWACSSLWAAPLLNYQDTGWRYRQVLSGDPLESTFMPPLFDDSGWATGQAAFGSGGGCPLQPTVHTAWSVNTDMLLRKWFLADASAATTIHLVIDNDVIVYVNGTQIFATSHGGCPGLDDFNFAVPPNVLTYGNNLVAVRAIDYGAESFFDLRIDGEQPVAAPTSTWGRLKSIYR